MGFFKNPGTHDKNMMVTGDSGYKLFLYTTTISKYPELYLDCRFPEVQDISLKVSYCGISDQHTMCRFKTAAPGCDPSEFGLSDNLQDVLVDKLNKERRIIATGNSVNSLPVATNMRKISWNDELARIAQMWAVQCNMELDYYRTALIDGVPVQFGQNIARFEFNSDIGISETQINELVNYWINSYEPQVLDLINNRYTYQPPQDEYNLSYFTQMAWALTDHRMWICPIQGRGQSEEYFSFCLQLCQ